MDFEAKKMQKLLLLIGVLVISFFVLTCQANYSTQPLTPATAPCTSHSKPVSESLARNKRMIPEDGPFIFQNVLLKSDMANGKFTCTIERSDEPCPNSIKKFNYLIKSELQNQLLNSDRINAVFFLGQLTPYGRNVVFKVREKYQIQDIGFNSEEIDPKVIFKSKDFDWNENVSYGQKTKNVTVGWNREKVNKFFEDGLDNIRYPCASSDFPYNLCSITQPIMKNVTKFSKVLFGLTNYNLKWTTGVTKDWDMIVSEYELTGQLNMFMKSFFAERSRIMESIDTFDEQQTNWCKCVWNEEIFYEGFDKKKCFKSESTEIGFRAILDPNLCPIGLEQRISERTIDWFFD